MAGTFTVQSVWDLGHTKHILGSIVGGVIKGGERLQEPVSGIQLEVVSVAIGGGSRVSEDSITVVVHDLPRETAELVGRTFQICNQVGSTVKPDRRTIVKNGLGRRSRWIFIKRYFERNGSGEKPNRRVKDRKY